jgi:hypothetical protein
MDENDKGAPAAFPRAGWEWYGGAGHFICARWCRFHLCTKVGPWLVSTVGEYWPDRPVREIHAKVHDPAWLAANARLRGNEFDAAYMLRFGYVEIGFDRKYETMVFRADAPCVSASCGCGMPAIDGNDLDSSSYNVAGDATIGHLALCEKWSRLTEDPDAEGPEPDLMAGRPEESESYRASMRDAGRGHLLP